MPRTLTTEQEIQLLKDTIRQGHELLQALNDAIKQARKLQPDLVDRFEQTHHQEIAQLSNLFTTESNRLSADLNRQVNEAREMIMNYLMSGEARFDRTTETVTIKWSAARFDDQVPLPYPKEQIWSDPQ